MNKLALVRIIAFVLTWVNSYLVQKGYQPLPVLEEEFISHAITFIISVWTLATNNTVKKTDKPV